MRLLYSFVIPAALSVHAAMATPVPRTYHDLSQRIAERTSRVPEFVEIGKMAESRGLKVYLFGGTAAGFAHYVKWDLDREAGDPRLQADRFDYDFMNIYRSTQDLDIVIDAGADQVREFQRALQEKFPYFVGSKEQWEVRSLREKVHDKEALLNDPDFLNQHTDSNSTGMIELTGSGKYSVRDLRDWESREPQFLRDVADGKLRYYFSEKHETTSRFMQGKNPPIISVIRYLTKAFQYGLELRAEDLEQVRRIIKEFDPSHASSQDHYVKYWIEKNGAKLFRHAVDLEYAWNTLEELGLRKKLIALSNPNQQGSTGWWLNREPLRTRPLAPMGPPTGKSAAELGISIVTHETSDFLAYESIRKSHEGFPNVFISRNGTVGETAAYGNGFYTRIGREGARGTGFHIRMHVDPTAREGVDFTVAAGDYVVWHTRDKLRIIQESLLFSPKAALEFILDESNTNERGVLEMFRRRLSRLSWHDGSLREAEEVAEAVVNSPNRLHDSINKIMSNGLFDGSTRWNQWFETLVRRRLRDDPNAAFGSTFTQLFAIPRALDHPAYNELFTAYLEIPRAHLQAMYTILNSPAIITHPRTRGKWPEWILRAIEQAAPEFYQVHEILVLEEAIRHPAWEGLIRQLIQRPNWFESVAVRVLSKSQVRTHPAWPDLVVELMEGAEAQLPHRVQLLPVVDQLIVPAIGDGHPRAYELAERLVRIGGAGDPLNGYGMLRDLAIPAFKRKGDPAWKRLTISLIDAMMTDPKFGPDSAGSLLWTGIHNWGKPTLESQLQEWADIIDQLIQRSELHGELLRVLVDGFRYNYRTERRKFVSWLDSIVATGAADQSLRTTVASYDGHQLEPKHVYALRLAPAQRPKFLARPMTLPEKFDLLLTELADVDHKLRDNLVVTVLHELSTMAPFKSTKLRAKLSALLDASLRTEGEPKLTFWKLLFGTDYFSKDPNLERWVEKGLSKVRQAAPELLTEFANAPHLMTQKSWSRWAKAILNRITYEQDHHYASRILKMTETHPKLALRLGKFVIRDHRWPAEVVTTALKLPPFVGTNAWRAYVTRKLHNPQSELGKAIINNVLTDTTVSTTPDWMLLVELGIARLMLVESLSLRWELLRKLFTDYHIRRHPQLEHLMVRLLEKSDPAFMVKLFNELLPYRGVNQFQVFIEKLIDRLIETGSPELPALISTFDWDWVKTIDKMVESGRFATQLINKFTGRAGGYIPGMKRHDALRWVERIIEQGDADAKVKELANVQGILPTWFLALRYPVEKRTQILRRPLTLDEKFELLFDQSYANGSELVSILLQEVERDLREGIAFDGNLFERIADEAFKNEMSRTRLAKLILQNRVFYWHPKFTEWMKVLLERGSIHDDMKGMAALALAECEILLSRK